MNKEVQSNRLYHVKCFKELRYRINIDIPDPGSTVCQSAQIARSMGPTWGPLGSCRPQVGPILAPWTSLSICISCYTLFLQLIFIQELMQNFFHHNWMCMNALWLPNPSPYKLNRLVFTAAFSSNLISLFGAAGGRVIHKKRKLISKTTEQFKIHIMEIVK